MTGDVRRRVKLSPATTGTRVSAIYHRPADAWALYVLAHGAGAGMEHPFMAAVASRLFDEGIATLRYQFPYMEAGRKRPDAPPAAQATVRAAVSRAVSLAPDLPVIAGGKSFGGRMTSAADATEPLDVCGICFLGFPLHAPGRNSDKRGAHLRDVSVPMLFLQGTRDPLADLDLMRALCRDLGAGATLHVVDGGDHSFNVLKRSGRTADQVMAEMTGAIAGWARGVVGA